MVESLSTFWMATSSYLHTRIPPVKWRPMLKMIWIRCPSCTNFRAVRGVDGIFLHFFPGAMELCLFPFRRLELRIFRSAHDKSDSCWCHCAMKPRMMIQADLSFYFCCCPISKTDGRQTGNFQVSTQVVDKLVELVKSVGASEAQHLRWEDGAEFGCYQLHMQYLYVCTNIYIYIFTHTYFYLLIN